jgi:bacteriocin-like protein
MRKLEMNNRTKELKDEELARVSGGLNPQPLPPGPERSFISVNRFSLFSEISAFRFW